MPYHPRMEFDPPMNSSSYAYYLNSLTGMANPSSHPLQLRPKASMEMPVPIQGFSSFLRQLLRERKEIFGFQA